MAVVRRVSWIFRLIGTVLAAALFVTGVTLAIAPRLWGIANSHDELPTSLPPFEPLAQRSYVYDRSGAEIAIFQQENIQPFALAQVPPDVVKAVLAVEDKEFYTHDGVSLNSTAWARRLGIAKATMIERLQKWPLLQALGVEPRPPQVRVPPKVTPESRAKMRAAHAARRERRMQGLPA